VSPNAVGVAAQTACHPTPGLVHEHEGAWCGAGYVACTTNPDGAWMLQQARNFRMDLDGRGQQPRFLIHDRDTKFTHAFDALFRGEGCASSEPRSGRRTRTRTWSAGS